MAGHAPFCWGKNAGDAASNAVIVEEIAAMALNTVSANPRARAISKHLHQKHFFRKHGSSGYYGQK